MEDGWIRKVSGVIMRVIRLMGDQKLDIDK